MSLHGRNQLEAIILSTLYKKNGKMGTYNLYKILKMPISDFMQKIFDLQNRKLLQQDGDFIKLTEAGVAALLELRPSTEKVKSSKIPTRMIRTSTLDAADPYIPSLSRLDKNLFNL